MHFLLLASALILSAIALPATADEQTREQATKAQLAELTTQIKSIQSTMRSKIGTRDILQTELRETEVAIGQLDQQLRRLNAAIAAELPKLAQLTAEQQRLDQAMQKQESAIISEIRNLWALQQGGALRLLLGDQPPERIARNRAYYQRLLASRTARVDTFTVLADEAEANANAIRETQARLARQRNQLAEQRSQIDALQDKRRSTLADLKKSLSNDSQAITKLEADSNRLSKLLEALQEALAELDTPASYVPFSEAKGQLPYPVRGKPSSRFGDQRNSGNMRWRGWLMPAREGVDVTAIHYGRVVYSDWLGGHGLLTIIDHGNGWLSLYGQNRSLQREVGDWVGPGDTIAQVGSSGGADFPGLYFEIRHNGEPVNPGIWLKR